MTGYLLYHLNPGQVDPLAGPNCLIFATGPITASAIWGSSRYGVLTKSPPTDFYSESYSGGKVPEVIDSTGFDAVVIHGQSEEPIVLSIHLGGVEFHKTGDIWGMDTFETENTVIKQFGHGADRCRFGGLTTVIGENLGI